MSRDSFYWWVILGWGLIIVVALIALLIQFMEKNNHIDYRQLLIASHEIKVEIADDVNEQYQGLSGRSGLANNTGLLFIYQQPTNDNFWMQGMKFPLDFIWIADNQVVQIDENIQPPPSAQDEPVRIYPQQRYDMVLEVMAGWVKSNNISLGDKVELK